MKKVFCSVFFYDTSVGENFWPLIWVPPSYLSRQKGTLGNISQLRPRPQKCGLGFKKLSLASLWEKLKSQVKTVSYRPVIKKNRRECFFHFTLFFAEFWLQYGEKGNLVRKIPRLMENCYTPSGKIFPLDVLALTLCTEN